MRVTNLLANEGRAKVAAIMTCIMVRIWGEAVGRGLIPEGRRRRDEAICHMLLPH